MWNSIWNWMQLSANNLNTITQPPRVSSQCSQCWSQAQINGESCVRKNILCKIYAKSICRTWNRFPLVNNDQQWQCQPMGCQWKLLRGDHARRQCERKKCSHVAVRIGTLNVGRWRESASWYKAENEVYAGIHCVQKSSKSKNNRGYYKMFFFPTAGEESAITGW